MIRAIKKIIDILFIAIIVVLGIYFVLRVTNKVVIYEVKTGSMEDGIHVGDYILTYTTQNYKIGDVVTFKNEGYFVTHRIIKKNGNKIVTKGDANNTEDEEIDIKDIKGKVIYNGGILNILIDYKFVIIGVMLMIYLITYYLDSGEEVKIKK